MPGITKCPYMLTFLCVIPISSMALGKSLNLSGHSFDN